MNVPRFSIAGIMALTALIALDCLAARVAWDSHDIRFLILFCGGLPWLNVLMVGLALLRGSMTKSGPIAFLVGYEVAGWVTFLLFLALNFGYPAACDAAFMRMTYPLNPLTEMAPPVGLVAAVGVIMVAMTFPHIILASLAGVLNRRYRVRIERRGPVGVGP